MRRFFTFVLPILLLAFVLSVMVRWPQLNRPVSKHHEFCTAVALRVMQVWDQGGIANYHFTPAMNYPGSENAFINNDASSSGRMLDYKGSYYYISHPPLAYYVPYASFQLFGLDFNEMNIRWFHLIFQFLCGVLIFLLVGLLFENALLPALAAFLVYLFNPATLWFQSNVYMSDMFVQIFFILGVFLFLKRELFHGKLLPFLGLIASSIFLMTYTTWLGVFFAATTFLWGAFHFKDHLVGWKLSLASVIGCAAALALVIIQYSQVNGMEAVFDEWFNRVKVRSGYSPAIGSVFFLKGLIQNAPVIALNYITSYASVFAILVPLLAMTILQVKQFHTKWSELVWVSVVPVLLLHLVLSDYSAHDFTSLWGSVFLSIAIGFLIHGISKQFEQNRTIPKLLFLLVVMGCLIGIAQFQVINRPGEVSQSGDRYDREKMAAEKVNTTADSGEMIFLMGEKPTPQMIFYAGRNMRYVRSEDEARSVQHEQNIKSGLLFSLDENYEIELRSKLTTHGK